MNLPQWDGCDMNILHGRVIDPALPMLEFVRYFV